MGPPAAAGRKDGRMGWLVVGAMVVVVVVVVVADG
jgi:hypothetical protein